MIAERARIGKGPARVTTLAAAAGIGQSSMTELVHPSERKGLLAPGSRTPRTGGQLLQRSPTPGGRCSTTPRTCAVAATGWLSCSRVSPADDEAALTLAMHVALPIIRRLIDDAQRSPARADSDTLMNEPT